MMLCASICGLLYSLRQPVNAFTDTLPNVQFHQRNGWNNSSQQYINIVHKDIQEACLVTALVLKFARVRYGIIILHACTKRV